MARFFLNQKVRVVKDLLGMTPHTIGKASVIVMFDNWDRSAFSKPWNIGLKDFPGIWFHPDELEPIVDNHEPCEAEFKEALDLLCNRSEEALP